MGAIDTRGPEASPNVLDGYVLEEGAIPQALAPVMQGMLEVSPGKRFTAYTVAGHIGRFLSRSSSMLFGPYYKGGALDRTQTYLVMSHDNNEGVMSLENDKPYLQFSGVQRTEHVKKLDEMLASVTKAIGGTLINSIFHDGEY